VILVTVGNDLPFSRLVRHADAWSKAHPSEHVFAQTGRLQPSDHVPEHVDWVEMLSAEQFEHLWDKAKLVVAHAGMGSIITALATSKPIVILPRQARLAEHRNDHQLATAKRFADRPGLFVAWAEADLPAAIDRALKSPATPSDDRLPQFAPAEFTDRLRQYILHGRRPPL
jgi:UDP-N-acetylglucosamine transferase subunit ALG13